MLIYLLVYLSKKEILIDSFVYRDGNCSTHEKVFGVSTSPSRSPLRYLVKLTPGTTHSLISCCLPIKRLQNYVNFLKSANRT